MNNRDTQRLRTYSDLLHEHEKKELRIVKQAIAKSFIASGKIGLQLSQETEQMMEEWIRWVYRDKQRDWRLVKEKDTPF